MPPSSSLIYLRLFPAEICPRAVFVVKGQLLAPTDWLPLCSVRLKDTLNQHLSHANKEPRAAVELNLKPQGQNSDNSRTWAKLCQGSQITDPHL